MAALAFIGINLLTGRDSSAQTGARLTPSRTRSTSPGTQTGTPGLAPPVAVAKAGELDTSFGRDGKVVTNLTHSHWDDWASALAIQADGKIVLAGGERYRVARYNSDCTLDATFGGDGKMRTGFNPRGDGAAGVALQADGRIVAAGWANSGRSKMKVALARYLAQ
jgi:uncharacterized delta-60 repeat protein